MDLENLLTIKEYSKAVGKIIKQRVKENMKHQDTHYRVLGWIIK